MSIEFQDVLKASVVLAGVVLLGDQHQRDNFADLVDTEIMSETVVTGPATPAALPGIPASATETGFVMTLPKDRIQLVSGASRTSIDRQYPTLEDLERLAKVAGHAIEVTNLEGQVPIAYGFNIELIYRQTEEKPSEQYIAERLFPNHQFGIEDWTLVGGGGKLSFEGNDARWNFAVEPRANDASGRRVFLSLNLHRNKQQIPNSDEILDSLHEIWKRSHDFAKQLDKSS